jgi:hypothetical protein
MSVPEQHDEAVIARRDRERAEASEHRQIAARIKGNRRSLQLTALITILFLIDFFWSSHTQDLTEQKAASIIAKACDFWYPLTSLPVTVPAGSRRPTELSVQIIAGAREGYAGQCSPPHRPLPPPDPSFTRWAAFYRVPVTAERLTGPPVVW